MDYLITKEVTIDSELLGEITVLCQIQNIATWSDDGITWKRSLCPLEVLTQPLDGWAHDVTDLTENDIETLRDVWDRF